MRVITIYKYAGAFAENKDVAREIRTTLLVPLIKREKEVILDFKKVEATTQSFVHALLSEVIREFDADVLEKIAFRNCNDTIKGIINIVVDYMQA